MYTYIHAYNLAKHDCCRVAQDCLKNFLLCSQYDSVAETVVDSAKLDVINNFDYFLAMIPAVTE